MPNISYYLRSRFNILVSMYYGDDAQHHLPHIHVEYKDVKAVIGIPGGEMLRTRGTLPGWVLREVRAWIERHDTELMDRWDHAVNRQAITRID